MDARQEGVVKFNQDSLFAPRRDVVFHTDTIAPIEALRRPKTVFRRTKLLIVAIPTRFTH